MPIGTITSTTTTAQQWVACLRCSQRFSKNDIKLLEGHPFCSACYELICFDCSFCELERDGYSYNKREINGEWVCESCLDNYYFQCASCEEYYHLDCAHPCDNCDNNFCEFCFEEHNHNDHSDSWEREVSLNFSKGKKDGCQYITVERFVGTEIECERGNRKKILEKLPKSVGIKRDGSLDNTGVEVQTPPVSLDKLESIVTKTCAILKKAGYKGTKSCGFHVHIDARDFKNDYVKIVRIIKTFYATEDLLYSMLPSSRWISQYCKRLSRDYLFKAFNQTKKGDEIDKEWYRQKAKEIIINKKLNKYDDTRYYGLNIHSIFYRQTLELRYHSGTVEESKILFWIELLLLMVEYALNHYDEKTIKNLYNLATGEKKLEQFWRTFSIPSSLRRYMGERTHKFNRNFTVKFNKGYEERKKEKERLRYKKRKGEELRKSLEKKARKKIVEAVRSGNFLPQNPLVIKLSDKSILADPQVQRGIESLIQKNMQPNYSEREAGFITDEELQPIISYITAGMAMAEEQGET